MGLLNTNINRVFTHNGAFGSPLAQQFNQVGIANGGVGNWNYNRVTATNTAVFSAGAMQSNTVVIVNS